MQAVLLNHPKPLSQALFSLYGSQGRVQNCERVGGGESEWWTYGGSNSPNWSRDTHKLTRIYAIIIIAYIRAIIAYIRDNYRVYIRVNLGVPLDQFGEFEPLTAGARPSKGVGGGASVATKLYCFVFVLSRVSLISILTMKKGGVPQTPGSAPGSVCNMLDAL